MADWIATMCVWGVAKVDKNEKCGEERRSKTKRISSDLMINFISTPTFAMCIDRSNEAD
jgi:hypothetical protein